MTTLVTNLYDVFPVQSSLFDGILSFGRGITIRTKAGHLKKPVTNPLDLVTSIQMSVIELSNVGVTRSQKAILNGVSFAVESGESVAIVGPNGAGKTTLLRAIAGHQPFTGSIRIGGIDVSQWKAKDLARALSFVRQSFSISFDFTTMDVVLLGRSPHKSLLQSYNAADRSRAQQLLDELDLTGKEDQSILDLSGGERQRVLLAQALAQETDVLLLDEPTSHLDIHHKYDFMTRVQSYGQQGITILSSMHDLQLAAQFADRIIVLSDGELIADGAPLDVLNSDLISEVFKINVRVDHRPSGDIQIQYKL